MKTRKVTGASFEIIGRLKDVPTVRDVEGHLVTNVTLAVDIQRKLDNGAFEEATEWYRVALWEQAAKFVQNHARAGMRLKLSAIVKQKRKEIIDAEGQVQVFYLPEFSTNHVEPMDAIASKDVDVEDTLQS